jgi:hypothetical protein
VAWKNGYYYRNRRQGNKVVSEYGGGGYEGLLIEQLDQNERHKAELRRKAWQTIKAREKALDQRINEIVSAADDYVTALMLVSGHHLHKRQWRKIRNGNR